MSEKKQKNRSFNKINDVYHFKSIDCCDSIFYIAFLETRHTTTTTFFFFEIFIEIELVMKIALYMLLLCLFSLFMKNGEDPIEFDAK